MFFLRSLKYKIKFHVSEKKIKISKFKSIINKNFNILLKVKFRNLLKCETNLFAANDYYNRKMKMKILKLFLKNYCIDNMYKL